MHASFEVAVGIFGGGGGRGGGASPKFCIFLVIQQIGFGALSQSPPRQSWWERGRRGRGWLAGCWFSAPKTAPRLLLASTAARKLRGDAPPRNPPWPSVVVSGFSSRSKCSGPLAEDPSRTEPHRPCAPRSTLPTQRLPFVLVLFSFFPAEDVCVIMFSEGSLLPLRDWTLH